jgi:hypothetical protein
MEKWFEKLPRILQVILLLIPGVNWVIEVLVRWNHAARKKSLFKYLIAIIVTVFGLVFGWVDVVWCLLFKHLFLAR